MNSFQRWYKSHAKEFNEKRRSRYRKDKSYREKIVERQAEYRARRSGAVKEKKQLTKLDVNGNLQKVFRIGEVAQSLGRSQQTIRKWEKDGLLPGRTIETSHRYYTAVQVQQMGKLCLVLEEPIKNRRARLLENWRNEALKVWES